MAKITSLEDLKDYCLRRLGAPVINIELDDVQAYERLNDAMEYFIERHYDGAEEVFYKYTVQRNDVTNGFLAIPPEFISVTEVLQSKTISSGEPMFDFEFQIMKDYNAQAASKQIQDFYVARQHLSLIHSLFSPTYSFEYNSIANRMRPNWKISDIGSANLIKDALDITTSEWSEVNSVATSNDTIDPVSKNLAHTVTSSGAGLFSISQTYDSNAYINGTISAWVSLQTGTYSGDLTITIQDSAGTVVGTKIITPGSAWKGEFITVNYTEAHLDNIVLTISGTAIGAGETFHMYNPWLYANAKIILHGYTSIDSTVSTDVYNDRWIKEYSTALIKRQWGTNIKKFDGVQLPGGITMNGQQIFDEANEEIQRLEEKFSLEYELPCDHFWG